MRTFLEGRLHPPSLEGRLHPSSLEGHLRHSPSKELTRAPAGSSASWCGTFRRPSRTQSVFAGKRVVVDRRSEPLDRSRAVVVTVVPTFGEDDSGGETILSFEPMLRVPRGVTFVHRQLQIALLGGRKPGTTDRQPPRLPALLSNRGVLGRILVCGQRTLEERVRSDGYVVRSDRNIVRSERCVVRSVGYVTLEFGRPPWSATGSQTKRPSNTNGRCSSTV